jgi:hypothetical protein
MLLLCRAIYCEQSPFKNNLITKYEFEIEVSFVDNYNVKYR